LHQRFITDFALAWADHVAFVEDDQANIIDQGRVASEREIELFRRCNDDLAGAQGVFVTSRKAAGAVKRGNAEAERREGLSEGTLRLGGQCAQWRDDQYPSL